jgi:hypothetical protein
MMTFLMATCAASATWLLLMHRAQNHRIRRRSPRSDAADSGDYSAASTGFGWQGHFDNSTNGCGGLDGGSGDSGGGDCGGGGDGGGGGE